MSSPYDGIGSEGWLERTRELLESYPLAKDEIVEVVLDQWESIFRTSAP
jgi:hypothetical protein